MELLAIGYVDVDHQSQEECLTYEQSQVLVLLSLQFPPQPFAGSVVVTIATVIVSMSRLPCQPRVIIVAFTMTAILVAQYRYYNRYRYRVLLSMRALFSVLIGRPNIPSQGSGCQHLRL
jgi:hypothetical protein